MISIENLSIKYGDDFIVRNMNLEIKDGDFVVVLGSNGSGKTSLFKCILGEAEYEGNILIDGVNNKKHIDWTKFGYVAQKNSINHDIPITVYEYLKLYSKDYKKLNELIDKFDLKDMLRKKLNALSGGQFQRVNIVKALLQDIKYLFLDEPDGNLDKLKKDKFFQFYKKYNEKGITIIMILHSLDNVSGANKIYDIEKKELEVLG